MAAGHAQAPLGLTVSRSYRLIEILSLAFSALLLIHIAAGRLNFFLFKLLSFSPCAFYSGSDGAPADPQAGVDKLLQQKFPAARTVPHQRQPSAARRLEKPLREKLTCLPGGTEAS